MNQREIEILKTEEEFKDTLENEVVKQQKDNRRIEIKDIKFVGKTNWKDKNNSKDLSENVFIVEKKIKEIDENGNERIIQIKNYYLGDKCIAGQLGDEELIYSQNFENSEPDKVKAINELLSIVSEKDIEDSSLDRLNRKEMAEILTTYLGKEVLEEDIEEKLEELEYEKEERKDKDENDLSKKQVEKIKVNGIQKVDLNKLVDGKETLGNRLDLKQYDSLYVVYSDKVDEITAGVNKNNTTYSLVGMTKDGKARVLNDEFEMDNSVGNSGSREQTKIRANSTATRDNRDVSVYTRKSNGMSIGCENNKGNVDMFLYQKTLEENENVGIQIETSKTPVIPIKTREVLNRNKGIYQKEKVQDEIEEHIENDCIPNDVKDFDGNEETVSHEHLSEEIFNNYIEEIFNYENDNGEEKIKEVFSKEEIRDKLLRELKENSNKLTFGQIVENVKEEMNQDAEILTREHRL